MYMYIAHKSTLVCYCQHTTTLYIHYIHRYMSDIHGGMIIHLENSAGVSIREVASSVLVISVFSIQWASLNIGRGVMVNILRVLGSQCKDTCEERIRGFVLALNSFFSVDLHVF